MPISCRMFFVVSLAGSLLWGDSVSIVGGSRDGASAAGGPPAADTVVFSLPSPPRKLVPAAPATTAPPPVAESPKPTLPPEFGHESAIFLQQLIGSWTL